MFKVRIDTIFNRIDKIPLRMRRNVDTRARESAEKCVQIAKGLVPVDTGALRNSIHVEKDEELGYAAVAGADDTFYASFVEYGTVKMSARPYMTPASEATRTPFITAMRNAAEDAAR